MSCIIRIQLVAISHAGADIGDDWTYHVSVGGRFRRPVNGQGGGVPGRRYRVRRRTWTFRRRCGAFYTFDVAARLREDDLFFPDTGTANGTITVECPAIPGIVAGGPNVPVPGSVTEDLGFLGSGGTNRVTLHFNVLAECV